MAATSSGVRISDKESDGVFKDGLPNKDLIWDDGVYNPLGYRGTGYTARRPLRTHWASEVIVSWARS